METNSQHKPEETIMKPMLNFEIQKAYSIILTPKRLKVLTAIKILNNKYPNDKYRSRNNTTSKSICTLTDELTSYVTGTLNSLEYKYNLIVSSRINSFAYATGIYNTYTINEKGIAVIENHKYLMLDDKQKNGNVSCYEELFRTVKNSISGEPCGPSFSL